MRTSGQESVAAAGRGENRGSAYSVHVPLPAAGVPTEGMEGQERIFDKPHRERAFPWAKK